MSILDLMEHQINVLAKIPRKEDLNAGNYVRTPNEIRGDINRIKLQLERPNLTWKEKADKEAKLEQLNLELEFSREESARYAGMNSRKYSRTK